MLTRKDLEKLESGKDVLINTMGYEKTFHNIMPNDDLIAFDEKNKETCFRKKDQWQHWTIKKKTKKVKLLAYIDAYGYFSYILDTKAFSKAWTRVPYEDKEVEVEE